MSYSSTVLADSPIGYWRLGEASGTAAVDASGGGHDGVYVNTPTLGVAGALTGDSDTAVTFTAASAEDARITFWSGLQIATFTLEAWVKTTGSNQAILARQGTNGPYSMFVDASGKLQCIIKTPSTATYSGTAAINDGNWHHVVITRDDATAEIKFYVDGALDATATGTAVPAVSSTVGLAIASRATTPFLNGSLDEVAIYNTALSSTRIAAHHTAGITAAGTAASGSASLSLSGSGGTKGAGAGSAALSLSAAGAGAAVAAGSGALALSGSGASGGSSASSGAASLALAASGDAGAAAAGSGALIELGAGVAAGAIGGSATLELTGAGSADGSEPAAGSGSLTLTGVAADPASGDGFLELLAAGSAAVLYVTDTTNTDNGRTRSGRATVTITPEPAPAPPGRTFGERYDKAIALRTPVMVDGRPT